VRALAVTSLKRSAALPEVPTLDEVGLKGYEVTAWFGLATPAATPREVVLRLNEALNRSTQDPQVRETLESRGATVIQGTPEDCLAFVRNELEKWGPVVKRANVVPE
jgi:tripartite-type tricarboxylate transporter receptor subunit TctC